MLFFMASYLTLGVMLWPYMIPYSVTVGNAAAPDASLGFLFYGGMVVLPVIAVYTPVSTGCSAVKLIKTPPGTSPRAVPRGNPRPADSDS